MTTYVSADTGGKIVKLLIIGMVCFLLLIGYVLWQSYEGRVDLVSSQRGACERAKLDRRANAQGWRTAETARLKTLAADLHISDEAVKKMLRADPNPADPSDLVAARRYDRISSGLARRSKINCKKAFPDASFWP